MYPILYRLSDQKQISFYEEKVGKRQTRVYYHLEPSGSECLRELKQSYFSYTDMIAFLLHSNEGEDYEEQTMP